MSFLVATHSTFTLCICAFYEARTSWISEPVQAFHFKITATHAICFAELAEVHHNDILMTLAIRLLTSKTWQNCHSSWNEPWTVPDVTSSAKKLATLWPTRISVPRFHWLEHYAADPTDFLLCRWSLYPRKASCPRNEAVIGNNRQLLGSLESETLQVCPSVECWYLSSKICKIGETQRQVFEISAENTLNVFCPVPESSKIPSVSDITKFDILTVVALAAAAALSCADLCGCNPWVKAVAWRFSAPRPSLQTGWVRKAVQVLAGWGEPLWHLSVILDTLPKHIRTQLTTSHKKF